MKRIWITASLLNLIAGGCSTVGGVLGANSDGKDSKGISNPFANYQPGMQAQQGDPMVLRTKRSNGTVEVQIPNSNQSYTDFAIPINEKMSSGGRSPASEGGPSAEPAIDQTYKDQKPGISDREITRTFPQNLPEDEARRKEIEQELGLVRSEDMTPEKEKSYLASIDHIKQLYRGGRYEAAIIELDGVLREFPTNPRLYEMRGTLLSRLGQPDLALKSWKQALRFNPSNESLRRFIARKEQKRSIASP